MDKLMAGIGASMAGGAGAGSGAGSAAAGMGAPGGMSPGAFMAMMAASAAGAAEAEKAPGDAQAQEPSEEQKEAFVQEYAKYLEKLKEANPEEYKEVMKALQDAAREAKAGFEPQLPGGGAKLGADGVSTTAEDEGEEVVPEPGFVIKTTNQSKRKVFINVCQSDKVRTFSKKKQLAADGTEQEGISIPLSMGPPNAMKTKTGDPCVVFDCIVNPEVIKDCKEDRTGSFRHFVCELAIQYVETKHKTHLDHKYKLPRSQYKGSTVRSQRIRKKQAPVIEEISEPSASPKDTISGATMAAAATGTGTGAGKQRQPAQRSTANASSSSGGSGSAKQRVIRVKAPKEHMKHAVLWLYQGETEPLKWGEVAGDTVPVELVLRVQLDKMPADEVPQLDLAEEMVVVKAEGYHVLDVHLPTMVAYDSVDALVTMDRATSMMELRVPVLPKATLEERVAAKQPDLGSKPWLLAQALDTGDEHTSSNSTESKEDSKQGDGGTASSSTRYGSSGMSGIVDAVQEDEELPEDRFHAHDMISQHLLMERAAARAANKKKQAERDAKEATEKAAKEAEAVAAAERAKEEARHAAMAAAAADDDDTGEGELVLSNDIAMDLL